MLFGSPRLTNVIEEVQTEDIFSQVIIFCLAFIFAMVSLFFYVSLFLL